MRSLSGLSRVSLDVPEKADDVDEGKQGARGQLKKKNAVVGGRYVEEFGNAHGVMEAVGLLCYSFRNPKRKKGPR